MQVIYSLLLVGVLCITACGNAGSANAQQTEQKSTRKDLGVDEFAKKLVEDPAAQLVDVRTPGEYEEGHLANATNIDINANDFAAKLSKLDKTKPVFVYCKSGRRSSSAAEQMSGMGFLQVYTLNEGITGWTGKGNAVMKAK